MDIYSYFSIWSLLISYSIFIWGILLGVPKWLFLFAACFLTTTSIIGTFFITIPNVKNIAIADNISIQKVILEDSFIHSGPLILFLVLFNFISKNIIEDKAFIFSPFKISIKGYHKTILLLFIIVLAYLCYVKFENIYFYDYFTLIILSASVFVTSYQIYLNILN
jgi:hypothetical protein